MKVKPLRWPVVVALWLVVIGLAIAPILLIRDTEFGGADVAAEEAIVEIAPDYEPWFAPLFEPPGSETESLLFALQAGLGAGVIGYFFGWQHGRRQRRDR
ncbi:energy-coupling factor ABC transporter substrate-binding protein [Chloroflexus sp.]|uniref:energy-coupling factor ABC transporter substrate-binding protein n=1 Tax=Chloroflexus sp. TaxID=1904827 RepID=UPI0029FD4C0E|nr:energy-coupling factor ABC transporter substrate-binding protein [Chloroflexus sp.]MCX7858488.1 energy-coupling factor ABC transporter substrate-binding protein [Chloroflexus sp.]